jgi:hypothetical protein
VSSGQQASHNDGTLHCHNMRCNAKTAECFAILRGDFIHIVRDAYRRFVTVPQSVTDEPQPYLRRNEEASPFHLH